MDDVSITAVIHTLNEENNIANAIRSAFLVANEVIVADMMSDDGTTEVARSLGAQVISLPRMGYPEPVRAEVIAGLRTDWVLVLDADELVGPPLAARLREIAHGSEVDAVRIPRITHMVGARIRGAGWSLSRERHVRFHRPGAVIYSPMLHSKPTIATGTRVLELPDDDALSMVHFNYLGWDQFVDKMNRYTSVHAREAFEDGGVIGRGMMLRALLREFWDRYVRDRGYRDGYRGLVLALLMSTYQLLTFAKLRQLHEVGDSDSITLIYRQETERVLASPAAYPAEGD